MTSKFRNIFLVSSALQSITVFLLLKNNHELRDTSIVFLESGTTLFPRGYVRVIEIQATRNNRKIIRKNFEIIDKFADHNVILWVSDLFWPMNNFAYASFLKKQCLSKINFFDEGMVLYWRETIGLLRYIREFLKATVLSVELGRYCYLSTSPFYGVKKLGNIYAYHKDLLRCKTVQQINVGTGDLEDFRLTLGVGNLIIPRTASRKDAVLFLAGPYYRLSSKAEFNWLLRKLVIYLRESGFYNLYIKLHPTESKKDYIEYYQPHGFQLIECIDTLPVEAYADQMSGFDCVIGFNSSALLNLRKFGFRGNLVSFGLDYMASLAKFDRELMASQKKIFGSKGVIFRDIL